jgi:peptidoglycan/LPS O-acetylase OafA/YrhL
MRLQPIDALRGVAVLLVLGRHLPDAPGPLALWQRCGWVGVDLFFVLSGFLVSGLLFKEYQRTGEVRPGRFLMRRGFKIYPSLWVLVGVTAAVSGAPLSRVLVELLFLQNYAPRLLPHTWSLAVEEHFYLLLAGLVFLLSRWRALAAIPGVFVGVAVGSLVLRIWVRSSAPYDHDLHLFPTHLRLDGLMFGVLLSYLHTFHGETLAAWVRPRVGWLATAGIALVSPALVLVLEESWWVPTFGLTGLYLGFGLLLLAALFGPPLPARPLAFVGFYSYPIYLWHMAVRDALGGALETLPPVVGAALYVGAAVVVGVVLGWLVERPFLALRERLAAAPVVASGDARQAA